MADIRSPDRHLAFANGYLIFRADGSQVDPNSPEGLVIESIISQQVIDANDNIKQEIKFAWDTFPRDPIGRANYLISKGLDPNSPAPRFNSSR